MNHKRLRKQYKATPEVGHWLKYHKQKTKPMASITTDEIPADFAQYQNESKACCEIYELHRDEQFGRARNRLAEHVRQQATISANAEHAIILLEQQAEEIRRLKAKYQTAWNALVDITLTEPDKACELARNAMQACIDFA